MDELFTIVGVPSTSEPGVERRVYVGEDGPYFCDCRGFRLRKGPVADRKPCVHMNGLSDEVVAQAMALLRCGPIVPPSVTQRAVTQHAAPTRTSFIEIVKQTEEGAFVTVSDLRSHHLEVI